MTEPPPKKKSNKKPSERAKIDDADKRSIVISFRVTEADMAPYAEAMKASGKSRSLFFYQLFIEQKGRIVVTQKKEHTEDYSRYLFLVNKMSNNLNQIARLLNGLSKGKLLTVKQLMGALNNLNSIRLLLNSRLGRDN